MSASHFLWSIYNPLSATDGFFPSIPNFVSVHHILCRSVLFQLIYFDLLLLACVAIMNVENDEHHNQYQQFSLAAKKSVARISPPRILFRELLFFFLLLYLPFHFSCFTLFLTSSRLFSTWHCATGDCVLSHPRRVRSLYCLPGGKVSVNCQKVLCGLAFYIAGFHDVFHHAVFQ